MVKPKLPECHDFKVALCMTMGGDITTPPMTGLPTR